MTRREEIQKLIDEEMGIDNYGSSDYQVGVCDGVRLADKTMIEKARQWFNLHFHQVGTPREIKHDFQSKEKMWKSFTQFMEE